ncbi:MAG: beta strand repeat-containing protein [Candidatus Dormibacteria bacterium]
MTMRSRIPLLNRAHVLSLRGLLRSRLAALVTVLAVALIGTGVPISAYAKIVPIVPIVLPVYQDCSASLPAGTAPCLFGGFEMDGNTPMDTLNGIDWANLPSSDKLATFSDLYSDQADDGFKVGSQYLDQSGWTCTSHKSDPKDDITGGAVAFANVNVGTLIAPVIHRVAYFKFARVAGSGDTFLDFVFSKNTAATPASASCTALPLRSKGDIAVTFTFTNGGGVNSVDAGTWNGTGFTALPTGTRGVNYMAAFDGSGTFGEGALDLSATLTDGYFKCHSFGSLYMDSRASGQNSTNEMKDLVTPGLPPLCSTPTVSTLSSSTGNVTAGAVVHDTATVTGTAGAGQPTGTVDFHLCGPLTSATGCTTGGTDVGSQSTSTAGTLTETYVGPNSSRLNALGTYCWRADYTADQSTNYINATGPIDAGNECFTVVGDTTTTTSSSPTGAQKPGVSATDTATVALNSPATGAAPTGTVTFKLCNPGCTQVGDPVSLVNGSATSSAVDGTTSPNTLAVGSYCWEATYTPTGNYTGSSEVTHPTGECFTTGKQPTTTTTGVASQTVDVRSTATVHDTSDTPVFVPAGATLTPGTVTFNLYGPSVKADCTATAKYTSAAIAGIYSAGHVTADTGSISLADAHVSTSGTYWWLATYSGDSYNLPSSSTCGSEAVLAVDANIQVSPLTATDPIGDTHVVTGHLNVNDGTGWTNAPAGTTLTFSFTDAHGAHTAFVGGNTCLTVTTTGSCSASITSTTPGQTTISVKATVTLAGASVTRTTGDGLSGDSATALKTWVDANIAISPLTATDAVGDTHTLTATVKTNAGDGAGYVTAPKGTMVNFSLTNTNGATGAFVGGVHSCTTTSGSCSGQITSPSAGQTSVTASTTLSVGGVSLTRTTGDGLAGDSATASKIWVDGSVAISPLKATNVVTHEHVFTVTVTAIPAGATPVVFNSVTPSVTPAPTSQSNTCNSTHWAVSGNVLTCTMTINSSVTATYTVNVTAQMTIGGAALIRTTSPDGSQAGPGGSGPATKSYVAPNSTLVKAERDVTTPDTTQNAGGFAAGPITAFPADVLEYRLAYTNSGDGAASSVTVADTVPTPHATYVSGSCAGGVTCSYDPATNSLTWSLGTMPAGSNATLTFRVTLGTDFPAGTVTHVSNFGTVSSAEEPIKLSNTVVANVQPPAQSVLAATTVVPVLPKAGVQPSRLAGPALRGPAGWVLVGLLGLILAALACNAGLSLGDKDRQGRDSQ